MNRMFFALEAPPAWKTALGTWQKTCPATLKWSPPEGLHLTLAFLGDVPDPLLPALAQAGESLARAHGPFVLHSLGLGGFPRAEAARVLYLALAPSPALDGLVHHLRDTLTAASIPFDPKPFRPHLTLGRSSKPLVISEVGPGPEADPWPVGEVGFLQSLGGGRYARAGRWGLGQGSSTSTN